ncbi:hypothetical protein EV426DRAFT_570632 [Tirmania nivea]|nr:hypothetical protein EV426DRAFT_570632 [Tirmania nivea]
MPQWLPSPEIPTFGIRLQNRVLAVLKTDKKKKAISENRNSVRTQRLLDEGFKSASLYTRRKRVDRAKIGVPVGPAVIEHDSNTQQLVAMAEEWRNETVEGADNSPSKPNGLMSLYSVSLPSMTNLKRVETFETDDDESSVDAFAASIITEEGTEQRGKEKEVIKEGTIDLKGDDEEKDERQNMGEEGRRMEERQAVAETPQLVDLGPSNSAINHTPPKLEYNSRVQARLVIVPTTEVFIPVILEDAYRLNALPPRVIYEEILQLGSFFGIPPAPPPLLMPLPLPKPPVLRRTTTLCSLGKLISKPLVEKESIGSVLPITRNDLAVDPAFMVPTRRPPLPLRRSQSQASVRMTLFPAPSRRPSGGDIISTGSLDSRPVGELQISSLSSQYGSRNKNNGVLPEANALRLALTASLSKTPLH